MKHIKLFEIFTKSIEKSRPSEIFILDDDIDRLNTLSKAKLDGIFELEQNAHVGIGNTSLKDSPLFIVDAMLNFRPEDKPGPHDTINLSYLVKAFVDKKIIIINYDKTTDFLRKRINEHLKDYTVKRLSLQNFEDFINIYTGYDPVNFKFNK